MIVVFGSRGRSWNLETPLLLVDPRGIIFNSGDPEPETLFPEAREILGNYQTPEARSLPCPEISRTGAP